MALAELEEVDAHSVQGEDVVAHSVRDESDVDEHFVQGEDVVALSVHSELHLAGIKRAGFAHGFLFLSSLPAS